MTTKMNSYKEHCFRISSSQQIEQDIEEPKKRRMNVTKRSGTLGKFEEEKSGNTSN